MDRSDPIIVERNVNASVSEAWTALTVKDYMVEWYFENIPAFEAVVGFETEFLVESEERKFTHQWKITQVTENESITYLWSYPEYPGLGEVTFEIEELQKGCTVRVVNKGLDSFPDEVPEFARASCEGGWNYFMDRLASYWG